MTALPDISELIPFANHLADAARQSALRYFRQHVAVEQKADASPVTIADRATERVLRELIAGRFPEHSLYGEEYGRDTELGRYTWVIDPIDGTKSFVCGMPTFGTLIALLEEDSAVFGVIEIPVLKERWIGGRGLATTYNGQSCRAADCTQLSDAALLSTSIDMFEGERLARFEALSKTVRLRRFGGDCYAYGLLASGFIDLVVEADMAPYDYLALVPVVENAGGKISDWSGHPLTINSKGTVLAAATAALHDQALVYLSS